VYQVNFLRHDGLLNGALDEAGACPVYALQRAGQRLRGMKSIWAGSG
jgi:hypothetical protein